ncbi:MAG: hypothetical protein HYT46_01575 [Candidatus Vogelbacteria bacterium]|nr:hypothetical protein [Candidatus Vogelbacteria bacterium]
MPSNNLKIVIFIVALVGLLQILPDPKPSNAPPAGAPLLNSTPIELEKTETEIALPIPREEIINMLITAGVVDPDKIDVERLTDLHLLWAFGLANKNPILETGPMMDQRYGGAGRFASTGGWTLAKGNAMDHYGAHQFVILTAEQQTLVEKLAKNIYRPCCDNATYFPDCNHGMAMLGLLELLAANGASEEEMWQTALTANRLWFPDAYATIDEYLSKNGKNPATVPPQEILGVAYSSASGYQRVLAAVKPPTSGGASCGV